MLLMPPKCQVAPMAQAALSHYPLPDPTHASECYCFGNMGPLPLLAPKHEVHCLPCLDCGCGRMQEPVAAATDCGGRW